MLELLELIKHFGQKPRCAGIKLEFLDLNDPLGCIKGIRAFSGQGEDSLIKGMSRIGITKV